MSLTFNSPCSLHIKVVTTDITQISAVTWQIVDEHIVADTVCSKKCSLVLLVHEQEAPQKLCLSSSHFTACGDYKRNIYKNTSSVWKASKW